MPEGYVKVSQSALAFVLRWAADKFKVDKVQSAIKQLEWDQIGVVPNQAWQMANKAPEPSLMEVPEVNIRTPWWVNQIQTAESRASAAEVALKGSEERCKLLFDAKNMWMERARKAEAKIEVQTKNCAEQRVRAITAEERAAKAEGELQLKESLDLWAAGKVCTCKGQHNPSNSECYFEPETTAAKQQWADEVKPKKSAVPLRLLVEVVQGKDEQHPLSRRGHNVRNGVVEVTCSDELAMSVRELPPMPSLEVLRIKLLEFYGTGVGGTMMGIRAVLKACGLEVKE